MARKTWVQCLVTGKLIPKEEYVRIESNSPAIHGDIVSFVSPITKELITDRRQLREHNAKHGVTNSADYSPEFLSKRKRERDDVTTGNNPQANRERLATIHQVLSDNGIY